jgi:hypothetical protein
VVSAASSAHEQIDTAQAIAASLRSEAEFAQRYAAARAAMQQHAIDQEFALRVVEVTPDGQCLYGALFVTLQHVGVLARGDVGEGTRLVRAAVLDAIDRLRVEDLEALESRQVRDALCRAAYSLHAAKVLGESVPAPHTLLGEHDVVRAPGTSDEQWRAARFTALRALVATHRASESQSGHDLMLAVASLVWRVSIDLYVRDYTGGIGHQVCCCCVAFVTRSVLLVDSKRRQLVSHRRGFPLR